MRGYEVGVGVLALIVTAVTFVLVELRVQAAWMGAGFICATLGRELVRARNLNSIDVGAGLWLATAAALVAVLLLIIDMFLSVHENHDEE